MFKSLIWLRWLLLPFGLIHLWIIRLRNLAYDRGLLVSRKLPVPVISIGNIQAGGTGKTPLTLFLIKALQEKGLRVGVLSRGYGRQSSDTLTFVSGGEAKPTPATAGDEPMELWKAITKGGMGIAANRFEAGTALLQACELDCILLDDGMQHRQLYRDLDICTIDVSRWYAHPFLLPFSYLRDSKARLAAATIVLLSKWEKQSEQLALVKKEAARYTQTDSSVQKLLYVLSEPESLDGTLLPEKVKRIGVFTGIANPGHFIQSLQSNGYDVAMRFNLPDHHSFKISELESAVNKAKMQDISKLFITEKDAVKIRPLIQGNEILSARFAVVAAEVVPEDPKGLMDHILSVMNR